MRLPLLLLIPLLAAFPARALDWTDDFEYGLTYTDAAVTEGSDTVRLTDGPALAEWPESLGLAALAADDPAQRDYFTFKRRNGTLLTGVAGIDRGHSAGADARTTGVGRWTLHGDSLKSGQYDTAALFSGGFSARFFKGSLHLSKEVPDCRRLYVRYYLFVRWFRNTEPGDSSQLNIHMLQPGYLLGMALSPVHDSTVGLILHSQFFPVLANRIPLQRRVCVEYEVVVDTTARTAQIESWIDGASSGRSLVPLRRGTRYPPFSSLTFSHSTNDRPVSADFIMDDFCVSDHRVGPRSTPPRFELRPLASGRTDLFPIDSSRIAELELQIAESGSWCFPYFSQRLDSLQGARFQLRHYPFPAQNLSLRGRLRRSGEDWSVWSVPAPVSFVDTLDRNRPRVDSMFLSDRITGKRTDTLVIGRWYTVWFYPSDPKGFNNLQYNYLFFNSTRFPEGNVLNRGGLYDPAGNYFLSLSKEREINRTQVYVRSKPGTDYNISLYPTYTSYVDGARDPFVIDTLRKFWKTNFRLLPEAEPGTWLFQGCVVNNQEIPSLALRKKITVVRTLPLRGTNWLLVLAVFLGITGLAAFGLFFMLRRKDDLPVRDLDYRVKLALSFINQNYKKDLSIGAVADKVGANPAWLGRVFKKQVGIGMLSYLNNLRCKDAAELLKTSEKNIAEIGYAVGFNNPHYFKDVFKKFTGKSPVQYRKANFTVIPPQE